ncbi:MAG: hypothetical protein Q4E39_01740 [bacterium]|nr:hypothetical protein [bacterium]
MNLESFNDKKQANIKTAKEVIKKLDQNEVTLAEIKQLKRIIDNPYQATVKEVNDIASTVAEIKETGMSPSNTVVSTWAKKELGISPDEFGTILDSADTPEEAKINILKEMDAPEEMIKEVKSEYNSVNKR